ncbi:MAG: preprotein translocase subunit SecG [Hyphomicrobiaceae bacterium]
MTTVLLVIHLMIAATLVGVVLIQRSEGGALGIGGGGGGGFMTGRGKANLLTRTTAILATGFFLTSLLLSILAGAGRPTSLIDQLNKGTGTTETGGTTTGGSTSGTTTGGTTTSGGTTTGGTTSGTSSGGTTTPSAPQSQ